MKINPNFKKIAIKAAKESGKILEKNFGKTTKISHKENYTLVSNIDFESEKAIIKLIKKNFPSHDILAEETGGKLGNGYSWVIDALDGTTNYLSKFPFFSVSIALFYNKELILSVIFNPMTKELYFAEKGKGAYLNGKRIKIGERRFPLLILFGKGRSKKDFTKLKETLAKTIKKHGASITLRIWGAVSLELCYIASGKIDAFIDLGSNIWDLGAGILMVKEAGGIVTDLKGEEWDFKTKNIVVSNKKINKILLGLVK